MAGKGKHSRDPSQGYIYSTHAYHYGTVEPEIRRPSAHLRLFLHSNNGDSFDSVDDSDLGYPINAINSINSI